MATILEFPASPLRAGGSGRPLSGVAAEVLIFPGVRYEHWEEKPAAKSKKRPSGAGRDVLEFED